MVTEGSNSALACVVVVLRAPFADGVRLVAGLLQVLRQEDLARGHAVRDLGGGGIWSAAAEQRAQTTRVAHVLDEYVGADAGVRGVAPRHDRGPGGRAERLDIVGLELAPLRRETSQGARWSGGEARGGGAPALPGGPGVACA